MRKIAIINQKGGVGKTTTSANLGAALAEQGRRVVVVDLDPQANLTLHLGVEPDTEAPSAYTVLGGRTSFAEALQDTKEAGLQILPSNIDLSGAELELASAIGRDNLLADALDAWIEAHAKAHDGAEPADYVIFDCPPSLGLLSVNALAAANEVVITVQTEFLALMGMSKLVEIVQLIQRRLNPGLKITGIAPCLYDSRLRLAREVLGEIRKYFPGQVFATPVRSNVKLAEAPSFGTSIIDYAPESNGARDYRRLAIEMIAQETEHPELAQLPEARALADLPVTKPGEPEPGGPFAPPRGGSRPQVDRAPSPRVKVPRPEGEASVTLTPKAAPRPADPAPEGSGPRSVDAVEEELQIMRAQDLPPLPPEAFEIDS